MWASVQNQNTNRIKFQNGLGRPQTALQDNYLGRAGVKKTQIRIELGISNSKISNLTQYAVKNNDQKSREYTNRIFFPTKKYYGNPQPLF